MNEIGTLECGIDVGQGINSGLGKFGKNNEHRDLNKHRKHENISSSPWKKFQNLINVGSKTVGP
jgi:hypothetical protein